MEHFQIEFNFEKQIWELVDMEDNRDVLDSATYLDELRSSYPTIQLILPMGQMNKNLVVNA